jgi:hypothetical protein
MGISRGLSNTTAIRHRIKRCDRLVGNGKLATERHLIYAAMTRRIMCGITSRIRPEDRLDDERDRQLRLVGRGEVGEVTSRIGQGGSR